MTNLVHRIVPVVSPLPIIKNAAENEKIAADAKADRLGFRVFNVESKFIMLSPTPILF